MYLLDATMIEPWLYIHHDYNKTIQTRKINFICVASLQKGPHVAKLKNRDFSWS